MTNQELKLLGNWIYPRIQDLGSSKHITNNKQNLLKNYHYVIDNFFISSRLNSHYMAYLETLTSTNKKIFKSRCLSIFLLLYEHYLKNPQQYGYEPSSVLAKTISYWQIHLIRKYIGILKYTQMLNDENLDVPTANNPRWLITNKQLYLWTQKLENPLNSLAERIGLESRYI